MRNQAELMPMARTNDIIVQEIGEEMLVYDLKTDKAHNLNSTMARIWHECDGKTQVRDVALLFESELKTVIEIDFILLALVEMNRADLLLETTGHKKHQWVSRRDVLFKYALPTVSLPVVLSLVAPGPLQAQSCGMARDFCSGAGGGTCCPGSLCESSACCNVAGGPCSGESDCCFSNNCDIGAGRCI